MAPAFCARTREREREREREGGEDKGESGRAGSDRSRFIRSESLVRRVSFADTRRDYRAERHRDPSVTFVKGARDDVP
jgi:hypothetical protein